VLRFDCNTDFTIVERVGNLQIRVGVVTTVSTTKTSNCTAFPDRGLPAVFRGSKSSEIRGREYDVLSGGELRTLSSALADVTTNPVMATANSAVLATVLVSLCIIIMSSYLGIAWLVELGWPAEPGR
jgi:hypothetical protein